MFSKATKYLCKILAVHLTWILPIFRMKNINFFIFFF